jgi:hypothetical protein
MSVSITESGVTFGVFPQERLYYIEKSASYAALGEGFSTVEFIYMNRKNQLCFVEAKSSSPIQQHNPERFEEWVSEIVAKFCDSLQLFLTVFLQRREETEFGNAIQLANMKELPMKFILVLPRHEPDWLAPIQNELSKQLYNVY